MEKKIYSSPATDIVLLGISRSLMDDTEGPVNPYSDKTIKYDSNSTTMDLEEEEFMPAQRSLWD